MTELRYHFLQWFKRHHFLYIFGFLVFFKPIDPFLYDMLNTTKNITEQEYTQDFYPISVYSSAVTALLIFVFINFCYFNHVFIITIIGGMLLSLIWWSDVYVELQVAQGVKGCVIATDIIYYTSIYVSQEEVKKDEFARLTSYIRAVPLGAKMLAAFVSQLALANGWLNYKEIAFLSLPACAHGAFHTVHFPAMMEFDELPTTFVQKISLFKSKFKETMSNTHVLKWSLWSALTLGGFVGVSAKIQLLWTSSQRQNNELPYNGALEAVTALLSLLAVLLSGLIGTKWKHKNTFFCVVSVLQGVLLLSFAYVDHVWDYTIIYIILEIVYHFAMATISATIAENIYQNSCFGIVFGFIGLVSTIFNLMFLCIFNYAAKSLTIHDQFVAYGIYHLGIAALMILFCLLKL